MDDHSEFAEVTPQPEDLFMHGLLRHWVCLRNGRAEAMLGDLESRLDSAVLNVAPAEVRQDYALLGQAAVDGEADVASVRTWRDLVSRNPACEGLDALFKQRISLYAPPNEQVLLDAILEGLPASPGVSGQRAGIPLGPLLLVLMVVSIVAAMFLSWSDRLQFTQLALLLVNCVVIACGGLLAMRVISRTVWSDPGEHESGFLKDALAVRVRLAPALSIAVLGLLIPGIAWVISG